MSKMNGNTSEFLCLQIQQSFVFFFILTCVYFTELFTFMVWQDLDRKQLSVSEAAERNTNKY